MREDNLLAFRKRRPIPQTTDSGHESKWRLNLARRLIPMSAVMDAHSGRIVGRNLAPKTGSQLSFPPARATLPDDSDVGGINGVRFNHNSAFYAVTYVDFREIGRWPDLYREVNHALAGLAFGAYRIGIGVYGTDLAFKRPGLSQRGFEVWRLRVDPATGRKRQPEGERER